MGRKNWGPLWCFAVMCGLLGLTASKAQAQSYISASGTPTFVAPEPVEQGFTDDANGNLHLEFAFGSYPQRANNQPLAVRYVYDSNMIWNIGCGQAGCSWAPSNVNGYGWRLATNTGTISYLNCGQSGCSEWVYTDSVGTNRYFEVSLGTCPPPNSYASDSSGYMLVPCQTGIYAPDGSLVYSYAYEQPVSPGAEDTNGNYASWYSVAGATDTLGRPLPGTTVNCNGNQNETCYTVPTSQFPNSPYGTSTYTVTRATISVKTSFGQSGVSEFTGTMTVVQSIALPDGTSYTFKYDCDSATNSACGSPSGQNAYYGLLTSMTLPTSGSVSYGYTNFSDSYSNKIRWLNSRSTVGGTWSYTPQVISTCTSTQVGCQQKVTVRKPSGDSTVYTFTLNNGAWPVQIQSSDSSSNLLSTVSNTFDFSQSCPFTGCHGAAFIRLLTTQTTVSTASGNITKQTSLAYDSPQTGNVTSRKEWGYYSGTFPTTPDRATYTTYLTTGTNNIDRPLSVTLCNNSGSDSACPGGGSKVQQTLYTYDSYSACPSGGLANVPGVMNHDDTNFGTGYTTRGNATKIQNWTSGSSYLSTQVCYDTTGQVTQQTDPAGNVTQYGYADKFYSDNGTNTLSSYSPSKPTNAYVTSLIQPAIGTTAMGYYYGSGRETFMTDPNGVTGYSHFMDPFDRTTENDYPFVGWDKTSYPSALEADLYFAVYDTTPSTSCQSCQHTEVLADDWGRRISERIENYPNGTASVDTSYDVNGRMYSVSHPYQGSGAVYEYYRYDGLDRTTQNSHPDNQYSAALYGAAVTSAAGGVSTQQGSPATYGYGYPTLYRDEVGKVRQEWTDGFGRIIEVDEPALGNSQSSGSVTISGAEQSVVLQRCLHWLAGGDCEQWQNYTVYDTGTVSITVNGVYEATSYGSSSTPSSIASALASAFNSNPNSPVTASTSGSVVSLVSKTTGTGTEYTLSAASSTNDPTDFGGPSFTTTTSGANLTYDGAVGSLSSPVATFYKYDAADHTTQVIQGVQTRSFAYDGLGRATSVTTPEAGTETLAYAISGAPCGGDPTNLCQKTDARGVVTSYFYDQLNRLTGKSYVIPGGSNVAAMPNICTAPTGQSANVCYFYDQGGAGAHALGRRTQMVDPSGSESYTYDPAGRITQLVKVIGTSSYTLGYQYNAADQVTQIAYPSGHTVQMSYNVVGQLCEVAPQTSSCGNSSSPYATSYTYNPAGQLIGLKYGNGIYGTFGFSSTRLQLNCLDYSPTSRGGVCGHDTTTNFGLNYFYSLDQTNCPAGTPGNDGEIQCVVDATSTTITPGAGGRSIGYTFDALGRLSTSLSTGSTQFPQWGLSETYDKYGNRSSQTVTNGTGPSSSLSFANPGGAQTNHPDGWCFDLSGNLLSKTASPCPPLYPTFVYDGENRLVSAPAAGGTYIYDGNGVRVQKCVTNCTTSSTVFIFSGSQDIAEYDNGAAPSAPSREFVYSDAIPGSELLASITSGSTVTYFHPDHLNWRISTNSSGQISGAQAHFPFGESLYSQSGNEFVFTSYQRDPETGLDYALARYYDSMAGRFCSADPLGGQVDDPQTWNRYAYARNDPINLEDPSGQGFGSWLAGILEDIFKFFTGAIDDRSVQWGISGLATIGTVIRTVDEANPQGQAQSPNPQQNAQQPSVRPPYCDPAIMAAIQAAWDKQSHPNQMVPNSTEAGFPAYRYPDGSYSAGNGPRDKAPQIQLGNPKHFEIARRGSAVATFHTHPPGTSGLPSTPSDTAGEIGDTGAAVDNKIDVYVISNQGLAVASKTGERDPTWGKNNSPWIVQGIGKGIEGWFPKLQQLCGPK